LRLKSVVVDLLEHVSRPPAHWEREPDGQRAAWAHPVCRARVGVAAPEDAVQWVGSVCELDPLVARALAVDADVAVACLSIDGLLAASTERRRFRAVPRYPGVKVDVALALPQDVSAARGEQAIAKAGKGLVAGTELFDLYTGEAVGSGRKSMAWHVILQSDARTLTDKDAQKFLDRLQRLAVELGGELRKE
jgi:phenylalanyl-tRNA synthetase beta chain